MLKSFYASKRYDNDIIHMDVIAQTPGLEKWQGVYYRVYLHQHENVLVSTNKRGGGNTQFRETHYFQDQMKKLENETLFGRSKKEKRMEGKVLFCDKRPLIK